MARRDRTGGDVTGPQIRIDGVRRQFVRRDKTTVRALDDISFSVEHGEFLVLLGPSGCGKSTLLRTIAGLEQLDAGSISLQGRAVVDPARGIDIPTERRRLSMMFQSYALWPHLTVSQNVAYPLKARGVKRGEISRRVSDVLAMVGIPELASQHPGQISGGQAQRVALARALVSRDEIVLFDEPLSNVDAKVRETLRAEIGRLHKASGFTAVYVTHDQEEALTLATRICVMRQGAVQQIGTPEDLYDRPNSRYVATFMGSINEMPATFDGTVVDGRAIVDTPLGRLPVDYPARQNGELVVFSRPEAWDARPAGSAGAGRGIELPGRVNSATFLGSFVDLRVFVSGHEILVRTMDRTIGAGDDIVLGISPDRLIGRVDDGAPVAEEPVADTASVMAVGSRS
ncbi:ABC transporter ATP-binding protein [Cnuibacter physcomitrellae]|uniref:ABC transporter ATP-binding protein n=1 Tax=Cnuibacter physcomitrellae TaxID=1619308 RepID=UPI00217605C6|nr:ABC transporter ATP-binding protein [Cnuibacter physcomitrellae]MCS5498258.1 ABC transporter ATP-binding protein [Cnuibacter physcomitrellae]